jgi:hypothetical protein
MGEWLGTDYVSPRLRKYRNFKDARKFVCSLGLKSGEEWKEFCNSGELPEDIPKIPSLSYKNKGWISWLGYRNIIPLDLIYKGTASDLTY